MNRVFTVYDAIASRLNAADWLLPTLARAVFGAVLLGYFWASALTKFDGGPFGLALGAYAQIFPKAFEAVGYDAGALSIFHHLVALAGSWAEVVLPALVVLGLLTRLAALGMIGFIAVQSLTDVYGHLADAATIGAWFDRIPDALILDQRAFWVFVLVVLVIRGAGPVSVDRLLRR